MKLSFSTKGWHNKSFDEFCVLAKDMRFKGIELHNVKKTGSLPKTTAFSTTFPLPQHCASFMKCSFRYLALTV